MESFTELALSPAIKKAVAQMGYVKPTPIQKESIPILLEGATDFLGMAQTGTGKTAAFGIPLIEQINVANPYLQGVILCPTRELAMQVCDQLIQIGEVKGVKAIAIYGGADFRRQREQVRRGAHIVVATPGRLLDHLQQNTISLNKVRTLVLDEADEMISMGFQDELEAILEFTHAKARNIWLFAATMHGSLRKIADKYIKSPRRVEVNQKAMLSGTVKQFYFVVRDREKAKVLCRILDSEPEFYGIIFAETRMNVMELSTYLQTRGYSVDCLHGDKDQKAREFSMSLFRDRKIKILVCTDVAARGIDVKEITHVINYSLPLDLESYVHRIGRTGRSGSEGEAISLVDPKQVHLIGRIENMTKSRLETGKLATKDQIVSNQISASLAEFMAVSNHEKLAELMDEEWKKAIAGMNKVEIAARFLSQRFSRVLSEKEVESLDDRFPRRSDRGDRHGRHHDGRNRRPGGRPHFKKQRFQTPRSH